MDNCEIEIGYTVFSNHQGCGYIYDNENEMISQTEAKHVIINGKIIYPGDLTTLDGHLCRPVKYLGIKNSKVGKEMIFELGMEKDLFKTKYYYQSIFWITENRIFEMFSWNAGTDFLFKNGKWV